MCICEVPIYHVNLPLPLKKAKAVIYRQSCIKGTI